MAGILCVPDMMMAPMMAPYCQPDCKRFNSSIILSACFSRLSQAAFPKKRTLRWDSVCRTLKKKLMFIYFWERERDRDRERETETERENECGVAERDEDTDSEAGPRLWVVSTEPNAGLKFKNHETMTWAKVRRLTDWATQASLVCRIFIKVSLWSTFVKRRGRSRIRQKRNIALKAQWQIQTTPQGALKQEWPLKKYLFILRDR